MKPEAGKTRSVWMDSGAIQPNEALTENVQVDVCVVGAGIAGLTTAYLLAKSGKSVIVLDDGPIAAGETQRTTAHLSNVIDDRYFELQRVRGQEVAQIAYESHSAAIATIETIILEESIDCDFRRVDGYLFLSEGQKESDLRKEYEAARRVGFADIEYLENGPVPNSPINTSPCIRFPRQARFHVIKYLRGLAAAIQRMKVQIYTDQHVTDIEDGPPAKVQTDTGITLTCGSVVVATNSPISDMVTVYTKQAPYRTYVIAGLVPVGSVPDALYWDMQDPYHYIRLQESDAHPGYDLLIIGGEDHRTGQESDTEMCFTRLEQWAREWFPQLGPIEYKWSGQVNETHDGLAFIGKDPEHKGANIYIATGDSGMGMTHGTIAGVLLNGLIINGSHPWSSAYSPDRVAVKAIGELVRENVNMAMQYVNYVKPSEVHNIDEIAPGEGAVLNSGGKKIAAYKDPSGNVCEMSAVCPHMKAIVQWNDTEKTWDCPAHGSRFKATGEVVNGPANVGLECFSTGDDAQFGLGHDAIDPGSPGIEPRH